MISFGSQELKILVQKKALPTQAATLMNNSAPLEELTQLIAVVKQIGSCRDSL